MDIRTEPAARFTTEFRFEPRGRDPELFRVVGFSGRESVSDLFRFEIELHSDDAEIDLEALLHEPATLVIERDGEPVRRIHGVIAGLEQEELLAYDAAYRVVLVPALWRLSLSRRQRIFQDKSVVEIATDILLESGFTRDQFQFRLTEPERLVEREYVVQYRETDLDFVQRLLEHEGLHYYLEHGEEGALLVISDRSQGNPEIADDSSLYFHPSARHEETELSVQKLTAKLTAVPGEVLLADYNYRQPRIQMRANAKVEGATVGLVYDYGDHFKTRDEGSRLARVRAEEIDCARKRFHGESGCARLQPGHRFSLSDHFRSDWNMGHLLLEVEHEGSVTVDADGNATGVGYRNRFVAIDAEKRFRPARVTEKPRMHGIMNAVIDASHDTQLAEIDEYGRYKVRASFDVSEAADGWASRHMRMSQPYAGDRYGMHFPLHKQTEVLFACIDGDPDRPVIIGAVPNHDKKSHVVDGNRERNVIRTASGIVMQMIDKVA